MYYHYYSKQYEWPTDYLKQYDRPIVAVRGRPRRFSMAAPENGSSESTESEHDDDEEASFESVLRGRPQRFLVGGAENDSCESSESEHDDEAFLRGRPRDGFCGGTEDAPSDCFGCADDPSFRGRPRGRFSAGVEDAPSGSLRGRPRGRFRTGVEDAPVVFFGSPAEDEGVGSFSFG